MDGKRLYGINYGLMWCGKVLAQVVESTFIVREELGSSPIDVNFVLLFYY